MGEALIIRSGGNSQSGGGYTQKTEVININQTWKVPKAKNQEFMVRIFGGGGGANYSQMMTGTGGGGGNMNNSIFKLNEGDLIPITIGDAGSDKVYSNQYSGTNGGTTSFGTYLSATGGEVGDMTNGGNGGTGGGVGAYPPQTTSKNICAGSGTYGGGGGGYSGYREGDWTGIIFRTKGGNGGTYGGGGSFAEGISLGGYGNGATCSFSNKGTSSLQDSENGMNTVNLVTKIDYVGKGLKGSSYGGGGGYGGNGGNSCICNKYWYTGGGGGGYGGNGGDATQTGGGGGGGYGNDGADSRNTATTGGGYSGGGGGGYGPEGYGHGSGGIYKSGTLCTAKSGVCIISYLEPVQ